MRVAMATVSEQPTTRTLVQLRIADWIAGSLTASETELSEYIWTCERLSRGRNHEEHLIGAGNQLVTAAVNMDLGPLCQKYFANSSSNGYKRCSPNHSSLRPTRTRHPLTASSMNGGSLKAYKSSGTSPMASLGHGS